MKTNFITLQERPAFMQIIELDQQEETYDGYTLRIDFEHLSASIINLKKGGENSMDEEIKMDKKIVRVADKDFEDVYEMLIARKLNLEVDKQKAIDEAIKEINERFVEDEQKIDNCLREVSHEEEIEVPVEETAEEVSVENADNTVNV